MRPGHAETLDRAVREGIHNVAGDDFAHGFIKGIGLVVALALGGPDVFAKEFLAEGLLVNGPPKVHRLLNKLRQPSGRATQKERRKVSHSPQCRTWFCPGSLPTLDP